jgi:hypothetical protein
MQEPPAQFATQTIRVQFEKSISFGDDVVISIPKTGDVVSTMVFRVAWPADAPTVVQPSAGTAMINRVELMYKDQVIERHYGETMNMLNEITVPQAKQSALSALLGKGTTSNLAAYYIQFPFTVNIPIVALDESVKVRIVLNQSTVFTSAYAGSVQADLFVDYVYVSKAERDYMTLYPLTYMTQTFQLVRFRLPASFYQSTYSLLTRFANSVAELYWVIQNDTASNVYDYTNSGSDHLVSLRLATDTVDIITPDYASALYLRVIQGLEFHTRVPDSQFYMYSFGIAPELDAPSGTLNFSSLENQQHELTLTPCLTGRDVRIYARSYNVFHISDGEGHVVFPTQEAGPVDGTIKGVSTSQLGSAPGNGVFSLYYGGTGGSGNYGASGSAVDSFGNTYSCGTFGTSTLVVYNKDGSTFGTFNLVTGSTNTGYVVKYNTTGTALWVTTIGGPGSSSVNVTGIEVDTYGDLLMSGTTISTASQTVTLYTNGVSAYGTTLTTTAGTYDMFLTKLASATGTPQWLVPITGSVAGSEGANARQTIATYQNFLSVGTDLPGNAYLTFTSNSTSVSTSGTSRSTIGGTYNGSVSGIYSPNTYLAQFNKSGVFQWIAGVAGNPSGNIYVTSATTTVNGLTSVTGYFTSNAFTPFNTAGQTNTGYALTRADFDSYYGVPAAVTASTVNSYLATYTSTGTIQMLAQYVGSNVQSLSIAQDVSSNIVTCGTFVGSTLVFYNSSVSSIPPSLIGIGGALLPASGVDTYAFIAKYSSIGYFQWAVQLGGTGQTYLTSCTTDATNSVYSCGYTTSPTMTIGTRTLARIGTIDGIVVKYTASSAYAWAIQIGANGATVNCRSVAVDPLSQNIVVTGTYVSATRPVVVYTVSGIPSGVTLPATSVVQPFVIELKA